MDYDTLDSLLAQNYRAVRESGAPGDDCAGFAALRRAALREPLPPPLEAHLRSCPRCGEAVAEFRRALARPEAAPQPGRRANVAAAAALATVVLLAGTLVFGPRGRNLSEREYAAVLQASRHPDLRTTRADLEKRFPELFPAPDTSRTSEPETEEVTRPPVDSAFLARDPIEFQGADGFRRGPYLLAVDGRVVARDLSTPRTTIPSPANGWSSGVHIWTLQTTAGDRIAKGEFLILDARAERLTARAEAELGTDPLRLAAVYELIGLQTRAAALVTGALPRLPRDERARLRRRFHLDPEGSPP